MCTATEMLTTLYRVYTHVRYSGNERWIMMYNRDKKYESIKEDKF